MNVLEVSSLALAYLGDSIYESYIREYLIKKGISHVNDLQVESLNYVSAKSQARIIKNIMNKKIFNEKKLSVIKRARNTKSKSHPKSCDIITYQHATSLEALFGYLKLKKNEERIEEIISKILY